ncbi:isoprenoid synthase domain-containing protein [Lentinula aciculospora]|uniref:(2E,6E)-farnesyl diphosphate synthase n=1 Tax=Lentinula aciculospora TaxID=153920 RepID=A0A9W9A6F2_9AGAR|nr:isoprenoid synthase domain-containing protein [Lentinula aciculospora]
MRGCYTLCSRFRRGPSFQNSRRLLSLAPSSTNNHSKTPDPFALVAPELSRIRADLVRLLGSAHPGLDEIASYYFLRPSKQLRPLIILLFARATNGLGRDWPLKKWVSEQARPGGRTENLDEPLSRANILNDWNPNIQEKTSFYDPLLSLILPQTPTEIPPPPVSCFSSPKRTLISPASVLPTQMRLAQIVEMVHAASLLHDDVIDESPLRRGSLSAPEAFGNKFAVLGGNFILGRASAALARLGDPEVIQLIASVIANLVEGEILQMQDVDSPDGKAVPSSQVAKNAWTLYLQKTYMKTASLMAKGARSAVVLGGCADGEVYKEVAYAYGRNIGIAFQLVDDVLDYEAVEDTLGKPGGADLQLGLATGPALYAWEEHPQMGPLIERKFREKGDVELARDLVRKSAGVERTRALAVAYATQAREVLQALPESEARAALEVLTERVIKRRS